LRFIAASNYEIFAMLVDVLSYVYHENSLQCDLKPSM
jgi:hypothetical protein